jgi:hypothetical protein
MDCRRIVTLRLRLGHRGIKSVYEDVRDLEIDRQPA